MLPIRQRIDCSKERQFYQLVKSSKENEINARMIYKIMNDKFEHQHKYSVKSQAVMWSLSTQISELQKKVNVRLPKFYRLYDGQIEENYQDEESNSEIREIQKRFRFYREQLLGGLLEHNINTFENVIGKDVYNIELLFRASEH